MVDRRLERIAFVTRRFGDLQGLRSASLGAALIVCVVFWTLLPDGFAPPSIHHLPLLAQMMMLSLTRGLDAYYARSFGRALSEGRHGAVSNQNLWSQPATRGPAMVITAMFVDALKDPYLPGISLGAATLAAYSSWVLVRDWPERMHHLIGLAAGVAGMLIASSLPVVQRSFSDPIDPFTAAGIVLSYAIFGLGLLAVGLLDHRLLVTAMDGRAPGQVATHHPNRSVSRLRASLAGLYLTAMLMYLAFAGWPARPFELYKLLYVVMGALIVLELWSTTASGIAEHGRAYSALTRARERRLLAQVADLDVVTVKTETESDDLVVAVPQFDLLGHLVLPLAMACGALVDIAVRGSGLPSFLALALAASHLRIALRDWPSRKHYLLGTVAASISAAHFMFVPQHQALDWTVWFLILVCAAMLVGGLLDYRLTRSVGPDFSRERHADAI
jgi:hypothetical protein